MITVATCERPGARYVDATLDALAAEGALQCTRRVVLSDGPFCGDAPDWEIYGSVLGGGIRGTMWRAFRLALDLEVDRLLFCEDDIEPCRNAIRHILRLKVPDDSAFIDFHNMNRFPREETASGLYTCQTRGYHGNQCMLFPARTVAWLAMQDPQSVQQHALPHAADVALGELLAASPWPEYSIHFPCLVQHIGDVSVAHPGEILRRGRVPTHYAGRGFDALTLEVP